MPHLFEPFTLRGCTFRNRIIFPPIAKDLCSPEGEVTRKLLDHYVARAKGGAGFVMLEHSYIERRGRYSTRQTGLHHDGLVYGLRRVVEAVHDAVDAEVRLYDRLFSVANPGGDDWKSLINPDSVEVLTECRLEPGLSKALAEEHYQFERMGYFTVDSRDSRPGAPVFNRTVTLRDSWTKSSG